MQKKIAVIGAGNVGATAALYLAQKELGDVVLVDIVEGMARGKALDLMEAGPVLGYSTSVKGTNSFADIKGADVVLITSGLARVPGMTRLDLLKKNADIIKSVVESICKYASEAFIIVVTNPVDVMTYHALKVSGFNRERVFGQAGVLDGARFAYFIAEAIGVSMQDVQAMVLGGHGDSMVPLPRYTTVNGVAVSELIDKERLDKIIERTRNAGGEIVALLKTGSAYYSPAASSVHMVEAVLKDKKSFLSASVCLEGEYGLSDVCVGVPVKVGRMGVEKIIELELADAEREALHASAAVYKKSIGEL